MEKTIDTDDKRKIDESCTGTLVTDAQGASYDSRSAEYGTGRSGSSDSRTTPGDGDDHTVIYGVIAKLPFRLLMLIYMFYLVLACWNPPADVDFFAYMGQLFWAAFIVILTIFDLITGVVSTFLKRCVLTIVELLEILVNAVRGF